MPESNPQILLMMCDRCRGMTANLLPEITLQFSELRVLPVTCPTQIDPFAVIKLLQKSVDGIIVACPREACCCPDNKKVLKRRVIVKDILPVFNLHREQFQIASVSPFASEELYTLVKQMLDFLKTIRPETENLSYLRNEDILTDQFKWVN